MKNLLKYTVTLILCALVSGIFTPASAQKKKAVYTTIRMEIVDQDGNPVPNASVCSSQERYEYPAGAKGKVAIRVKVTDNLKVKAPGYGTKLLAAADYRNAAATVTLDKLADRTDDRHQLNTVTGDKISERRTVGSFSKVMGEELEQNPTMFLYEALGGRLNGLFTQTNSHVPGFTNQSGHVRATDGGGLIILVDGVQRSLDYVEPEVIESVQLLKDASLKALYGGGTRTNGILLITTKRGVPYENSVRVNVQSGVRVPTRLPEYLNSAEYTAMYNQALENIGLAPVYDPSKYDGSDPLQYPDVDYYDQFLNKVIKTTRANAQLTGGSKNTRYFLNLGYQTEGGLEKYTDYPNNDNVLTVRGNVDNTIFDFITIKVGVNAAIQKKHRPNMSTQTFFDMLSNTRPNEFPVTIPGYLVGSSEEYVLGGNEYRMTNPLGALTKNGYVEREYSYMQSDFAIDFDLDKFIPGLSIRPSFSFDIYNDYTQKKDGGYAVYELLYDADGNMLMDESGERAQFIKRGVDNPNTKQVRGGTSTNRNMAFQTVANWAGVFGKHDIKALANFQMQQKNNHNEINPRRKINAGIWANYMFDNMLVVDASLTALAVPTLARDKRFRPFPTVGAGWIISENDFMKDAKWVDYLKLRASYGIIPSANAGIGKGASYLYRDEWTAGGSYTFNSFNDIVTLTQTGNPDLKYQKTDEFNLGLDFELFKHRLSGSVGYFRNYFHGGFDNMSAIYPGITGKGSTLMQVNYNATLSQGVEAELNADLTFGDFSMRIGGNICYGYSKDTKKAYVDYPDELAGLETLWMNGDQRGYKVIGTFKDEEDIANSPRQTFGKVYPGDLKYEDTNNDGIVNTADRTVIGNTTPTIQYGINLAFRWKGFNLDVLGYGLAGFDQMLTTKYYQIYGNRKYSNVLKTGLPNGNPHPVLRADDANNNFVASDYWIVNGGFFKLRNLEFGYTLPHKASDKIGLNSLKFFFRGTNLFTISKIKDLDPESLDAGVGNFPLTSTFTGGISFTF
ncbi:MAG: SusC/RagA family TonB-linked outer membrane protein [Candidatus Cryptobacteroides sp.]